MNITRYDLVSRNYCMQTYDELQVAADGEWMRYDDHVGAVAAVTADRDLWRRRAEAAGWPQRAITPGSPR